MSHVDASTFLPATASTFDRVDASTWVLHATDAPIQLRFPAGPAVVLDDDGQWFVKPLAAEHPMPSVSLDGRGFAWVLPESVESDAPGWLVRTDGAVSIARAATAGGGILVTVAGNEVRLVAHESRPHADCFGHRYSLEFDGGDGLASALAAFYWGTMVPCVVERTRAENYPDADGFVLSTLASKYGGTYPDVDHEFQIKGRIAWGNALDRDVVRRMIELQLRVMREDPEQLWRNPCAVQPDGTREYHVRRSSLDGSTNAAMFLVTGNVEVLESVWLYVATTKDDAWLRRFIDDIEGAASAVEDCIDRFGRVWSDVYYEDQVIKDGRETLTGALVVHSFRLLADLERRLARTAEADRVDAVADRVANALSRPLPTGYWDVERKRFVDWVDRSGVVHDHVHLLANVLPVVFDLSTGEQTQAVLRTVDADVQEFQRFPTFLSSQIAAYTSDEIGDGGPYDLCAAGRYWYWDAVFWGWRHRGDVLLAQLCRVAAQAAQEGYVMGERYDMGHVYYVDGQDWHGAAHYYEYPCVYSWVLVGEYLGVRPSLDADVRVAPMLTEYGTVTLEQDGFALLYEYRADRFTLTNLHSRSRSFDVDLHGLYPGSAGPGLAGRVVIEPAASVTWSLPS